MKILFKDPRNHKKNRKSAPMDIVDSDGNYIGAIRHTYTNLRCHACGTANGLARISGFRLTIADRYWKNGKLLAKGFGGYAGEQFKKLGVAQAKAVEVCRGL